MNRFTNLSVRNILVLKTYLQSIFGDQYPFEIIQTINMLFYKLFNISISCGNMHTCLVFNNKVYGWGRNNCGQLGLGHNQNLNLSQMLHMEQTIDACRGKLDLPPIKTISCGDSHSIAITTNNELYVWGGNGWYQLGLGHIQNQNLPHKLNLPPIKKISCGCYHSVAITTNNEVYIWGDNGFGRLGLGHNQDLNLPQKLNLPPIKKISCGDSHSVAITTNNEVYAWGSNGSGQLGLGHNQTQNLPHKLNLPPIKKISCGDSHSVAITTNNEVYVWGDNRYGQLGLGHNQDLNSPKKLDLPHIKKISCGGYHSVTITTNNEVYVWGYNKYGQLGLGHDQDQNSPQMLQLERTIDSCRGKLNLPHIKKISCGYFHSVAITTNKELYVWGANGSGRVGLGHNQNQDSPKKIDFLN